MQPTQKDRKTKWIAGLGTVLFHVVFLILLLVIGLSYQVPPPEEQGVEVNIGNSETGFGEEATPIPGSETSPAQSAYSSTNDEQISTQSTEESIYLKNKKNQQTKPNQQPTTQETPVQEQINPNALFRRNTQTNGGSGSSQGVAGGVGDQGRPDGNPNSGNYSGSGSGSGKGSGISFSLSGRSSKSLPKPQYTSKEEGTVVVKIWVDKNGNVTRAEAGQRGTTAADGSLWKMAEQAARQSKFSADDDAADVQVGTITYKFLRTN